MGIFGIFKPKAKTDPISEEPEPLKQIDTETAASGDSARQEVEPELALWLSNGTTVKSIKELAAALRRIKTADYKEHVSNDRNEIAEWVQEVLNDQALARKLRKAKGKAQAALAVEKEIKALKKAAKAPKQPSFADLKEEPIQIQIPEAPLMPEAAAKPKRGLSWPFRKRDKKETEETIIEPQVAESSPADKFELSEDILEAGLPEEQAPEAEKPESIDSAKPVPENTAKKEKKGFLFFGRRPKEEKPAAETQAMPPQVFPIEEKEAEAPEARSYEPEPQHEEKESQATPTPELEEPQHTGTRHKKTKAKNEDMTEEDTQLERRLQDLEKIERELEKEEEALNSKRLDITRRRYEFIKQKGEVEKERFERFVSRHKLTTTAPEIMAKGDYTESYETVARGLPDFRLATAYGKERLEGLLEEAKQHIRENSFAEAQAALREVQEVFNTVFMTGNEKKQIEYEILEVEADLKLASLK